MLMNSTSSTYTVLMMVLVGSVGLRKYDGASRCICRKGSSIYAANRRVDSAPPCGMPCVVGKGFDVVLPSFNIKDVSDMRYCSIIREDGGTIGSRMPSNRVRSTVSNAFVRSIPKKWTTLL